VFGDVTWPQFLWSLVTLILCGFGAILPIWRWAQPVNYVAFWIVLVGIVGGTLGIIIWHPSISTADFPAFTTWNGTLEGSAGSLPAFGPLWPLLFVTIACGAISGWHSLVSSSGTARQLEKEGDALFVGGGSMFLEMFVAVLSLLAATVGVGAERYIELVGRGANAGVFANGLATFLNKIGLPTDYGLPYGMVFLTLMALTIMYLVVRFMRVASAEFLGDRVPVLRNTTVGTIVALVLSAVLIWTGFWSHIWILFGGANQLMAALALLLISLWLMSQGKNYLWAFVPFIFMFITTIAALAKTAYDTIDRALNVEGLSTTARFGSWLSGVIAIILIIAALVLAYDSLQAIQKYRSELATKAG
jgi:carbon starvation protein